MAYPLVLVLIVAWLALAWLGGVMAWNRGRSRWLGIAIALVLPVLGLIVIRLLPAKEDAAVMHAATRDQHDQVQQAEALEQRDAEERRSRHRSRRNERRRGVR